MAKSSMPAWLEPMAATLTQERPQKSPHAQSLRFDDWLFEKKYDGIRLLAFKRGTDIKLYSRNRLRQHLPAIEQAVAAIPVTDVILDGEVAWDGASGYHVFDILWLNGERTTALPLEERRALLKTLTFTTPMRRVDLLKDEEPWERARREGWETPFTVSKGLPRLRAHWVTPQIVVQVNFMEWTTHNKLRHPRLIGVRHDKKARDVVREVK